MCTFWKCCFIVALFYLPDCLFFTGPGCIWPRSGTKKQSLRGERGLVMPDRPAGQHRWRTKALKKFRFLLDWLCLLTDAKLCECPAGCDADRPERGSKDRRPASSRQAERRRRHSGWKVLSEERRGRWPACQHDGVHGNNRDQSRMEHNGPSERENFMQKFVSFLLLKLFVLKHWRMCVINPLNLIFFLNHLQQGNIELSDRPIPKPSSSSAAGSCGLPYWNNSFRGQKKPWLCLSSYWQGSPPTFYRITILGSVF